jgi:hypothetical protein
MSAQGALSQILPIHLNWKSMAADNLQKRIIFMKVAEKELKLKDRGGTRSGVDRRKFVYTAHLPERRSGRDRRKGFDRRSPIARRRSQARRADSNREDPFAVERRDALRIRFI